MKNIKPILLYAIVFWLLSTACGCSKQPPKEEIKIATWYPTDTMTSNAITSTVIHDGDMNLVSTAGKSGGSIQGRFMPPNRHY